MAYCTSSRLRFLVSLRLAIEQNLSFISSTQELYFLQGEHHVQKTCDHIHYCLDFFYAFVFYVLLKIKTTQTGT